MTKNQISSLIDRLTTRYTYDTVVCECGKVGEFKKPNNILIGDVLKGGFDAIAKRIRLSGYSLETGQGMIVQESAAFISDLVKYWTPCDPSTSLQQIIEKSGWEEVGIGIKGHEYERLKDPNARALFDFLLTLFPKK